MLLKTRKKMIGERIKLFASLHFIDLLYLFAKDQEIHKNGGNSEMKKGYMDLCDPLCKCRNTPKQIVHKHKLKNPKLRKVFAKLSLIKQGPYV